VELDHDRVLAVSAGGLLEVRPGAGCGDDRLEPIPFDGELPASPRQVLRAPGEGLHFVVIGPRQLGRLDLSSRTSRVLPIELPSGSWVGAAPMGPDTTILLDDRGQLHSLNAGDELVPLEQEPPSGNSVPYLTLGGRDGVVWAGGFDRLDRLRFTAPGQIAIEPVLAEAERTDWDQLGPQRRRAPWVAGIGARCRGHALAQTREDLNIGAGFSVSGIMRLFEIGSSRSEIVVSDPAGFENFSDALPTGAGIIARITWLEEQALSVFPHPSGTFVYAFGTESRSLPISSVTSGATAGGWVVSASGRLLQIDNNVPTPELARAVYWEPEGFRLAKSRIVR
jgi:hypothetical protein